MARPAAPETGLMDYNNAPPIFRTSFTRLCETWLTSQGGPCADRELDYMRCAGPVGYKRAKTECRKYLDDWTECVFKIKTQKRYEAMQHERKKQGKEFMKPPPQDSITTSYI